MGSAPNLKFVVYEDVSVVLKDRCTSIVIALNLFSLGFCRNFSKPNVVFWVDGIFGKWFLHLKGFSLEKTPGVDVLEGLISSGLIKEVSIFGSCSADFRFLCKENGINIVYENSMLAVDLNTMILDPKAVFTDVVIITLPSPKQEFLAFQIAERAHGSKILCIGGAANMVGNKKLRAPKWISAMNIEWIFRLKTDTRRRSWRLVSSLLSVTLNLKRLRKCDLTVRRKTSPYFHD